MENGCKCVQTEIDGSRTTLQRGIREGPRKREPFATIKRNGIAMVFRR